MDCEKLEGCFNIFTTKCDGNIAYHVGEDRVKVDGARLALSKKYSFDIKELKYMDQVHGADVEIVKEGIDLYKCDALVSDKKDVVLMVMVADCIPLLFFDAEKDVIGVAHAGRNGTFLGIASNTVKKMVDEFKSEAKNIKVVLGPSIQKCCYEVSDELANIALKSFGEEFVEGRLIDLQGINKKQLLEVGVKGENIIISSVCTKCGKGEYFSYRLDKECGRFSGLIALKDQLET